MPGVEVEEVVAALAIPSGAERHRLECAGLHGVVPVFMGVKKMLGELKRLASNHGSRAKRSRDAMIDRESVETERHSINKIAHKYTWDATIYLDQFRVN